MKIAIIGAGAMGCLYGGYLSQNHEVILIDSYQPQVDAIRQYGVTIQVGSEVKNFKNIQAEMSGEYNSDVDLVIIFVKTNYSESALLANKKLFGKNTVVMTLQNGAGHDRKIAQYVDTKNIIIGTTKNNAVNMGGGVTKHSGIGSTTIGSNSKECEKIDEIAKILADVGFEMEVSDDVQRVIWSKLFVNLSINTFTALIETPIGYMLQNQYAWDFAKRLVYEAVEVAEADGTYFDRREVLNMVKGVCESAGAGYSSMYQDRKNRAKMEIDAINGAIVEQAKLYGVPTPYNTLIVNLIHAVEGAYQFYD
ncbi:MAG: 2-dehydropantoate 2-reductase [Bacillota bacterium]